MDRRLSRRRIPRLWLAGGIGLGLLLLVGAAFAALSPRNAVRVSAENIRVGVVRHGPFQDYLPVRAEVTPSITMVVSAIAGGQVTRVDTNDGALVAAGQVLATLGNPQLRLEVSAREADIATRLSDASAQQLSLDRNRLEQERELAETNFQLLRARREHDVRAALRDKGFLAEAAVAPYVAEVRYYETRVVNLSAARTQQARGAAAQQAQLQEAASRLRRNLSEVQQSLDALVVRAPMGGRLTNFALQPGQTVKPGDELGQIGSEGTYKLVAQVDEFYLSRLTRGQPAQAEVGGRSIGLRVTRILPRVVNGRFAAELDFVAPAPADLQRGQSLDVRITLGDTRRATIAPYGPWVDAGGGSVFVLSRDGRRAVRRPVSVGRRNPQEVEVLSGLRPGDRIVTSASEDFAKFNTLIVHGGRP